MGKRRHWHHDYRRDAAARTVTHADGYTLHIGPPAANGEPLAQYAEGDGALAALQLAHGADAGRDAWWRIKADAVRYWLEAERREAWAAHRQKRGG